MNVDERRTARLLQVDWRQLELQRRELIKYCWDLEITTTEGAAAWGIINLLDDMSDEYFATGAVMLGAKETYPNEQTIDLDHEHIEGVCIPLYIDIWNDIENHDCAPSIDPDYSRKVLLEENVNE